MSQRYHRMSGRVITATPAARSGFGRNGVAATNTVGGVPAGGNAWRRGADPRVTWM